MFYDRSSIPDNFEWVIDINPLAWIIGAQREAMIDGQWPPAGVILGVVVLSTFVLGVGLLVFRRVEANLADEL